jgi:2',3'-cyclic-nucleotide 2'-phosphodiesterase (5'-nucleotidase family)
MPSPSFSRSFFPDLKRTIFSGETSLRFFKPKRVCFWKNVVYRWGSYHNAFESHALPLVWASRAVDASWGCVFFNLMVNRGGLVTDRTIIHASKILKAFFIFSLFLLGSLFSSGAVFARQVTFTILFTNDTHGQLEPTEDGWGGVARRATVLQAVRQEVGASKVVLVDAGDLFTGGPLSGLTRGEADAAAYQAMGYDAIAIGNHDLDYGADRLRELRLKYKTPWIAANLIRHGMNIVRPYELKYAGVRVGFIGFSNPNTPALTKRENTRGMVFNQPIAVARGLHTILKKDADIFVAVSHLGLDGDKALAKAATFLHVIVGGHSHDLLEKAVAPDKTAGAYAGPIIVQAGERGRYLGRLDLTVDGDKKNGYRVVSYRYHLIPLSKEVASDPAMEKLMQDFQSRYGGDLETKVCTVGKDSARRNDGDWPIACLSVDALRNAAQAEIGLLNSGSFRSDLKAGNMTKGGLMSLLPFDDQVVTVQMTGSMIRQVLERSLAKKGESGFLQLSGISVSGKPGAMEITVGNEALSSRREYKVAINDFLAGGGDGYDVFSRLKSREKLDLKLRDVVEKELKAVQSVPDTVDTPRWKSL